MSRLSDMIVAHQTDKKKIVGSDVITVVEAFNTSHLTQNLTTATEYRLGVKFEVKGFATTPEDLTDLTVMARRHILREVFGEFEPFIRNIERQLYNRDFGAARSAVQALANAMEL